GAPHPALSAAPGRAAPAPRQNCNSAAIKMFSFCSCMRNLGSINSAIDNPNCWNESPMEEAVLSADEAPANTQTLGPDQTPEGCQPENDLQFQAPRNVEGKFLKGQSGNPAGKPPGIRNRATMIRAIVRWRLRRGLAGSARQGDEWRQRRTAAHRHSPDRPAPAPRVEF